MSPVQLQTELRGGEPYAFYPLGDFVVVAPGVCGGRPTFKGTRLEVQTILDLVADGWSHERIICEYRTSGISAAAITEAIHLASGALQASVETLAA